ncbi:hypothetical protein niasHT_038514 [Heterodera trifolii]|uniref:Uncharacterized protein n=1 Tax=Heterodera trifolii TaxID=157864 RepID=A0ABD2J1U8_9BILA
MIDQLLLISASRTIPFSSGQRHQGSIQISEFQSAGTGGQLIDQPASRWPVISQQQHFLISHCFITDHSLISSRLSRSLTDQPPHSAPVFQNRTLEREQFIPKLLVGHKINGGPTQHQRPEKQQSIWPTSASAAPPQPGLLCPGTVGHRRRKQPQPQQRRRRLALGRQRSDGYLGAGRASAISSFGTVVDEPLTAQHIVGAHRTSGDEVSRRGQPGPGLNCWNSIRWARPSAGAGYRTSRLASTFETSGASAGGATSACSSSSAASTSATAPRTHSPPFGYAKLRSSDRAASTSRPLNDGTVIRANSRYGTTLLSSSGYSPINARAVSQHSVACGGAGGGSSSLKSPRRQQTATKTTAPALVAYRPISGSSSISQPRAALIDMRQNLRPVNKRHSVTDHHLLHSSSTMPMRTSSASTLLSNSVRAAFAASSSAMAPPAALFTNVSPTSSSATNKCVTSPTMSRSSSSVTSPVTTMAPRPIPKSERPWRQKLADAQRLRDAQEERVRHHRLPSSSGGGTGTGDPSSSSAYDATTMRLISATKATRRTNIEQLQQEAEQKLEKQIAALKCYVSEPGALDSSATVAKFRQRMAEGQAPASLTSISSAPSSANAAASASSASASSCSANSSSALLARMPSLNRRATTAVMQQDVQQQKLGNDVVGNTSSRKKKDRPISLVESALAGAGSRRLSVVKEGSVNGGDTSRPGSTDEQMSSPPPLPSEKSPQQPLATGNDGTAAATTTAPQASPLKSGGVGIKDSPKLGKKRRTSATATTAAPTVKKATTETAEQQQSAKDNKSFAKNSDGTAAVAKRKASPKTATTTTPAGTTTAKQQPQQPAQQMPSVKRATGNKNAENGVTDKNSGNGTKVPSSTAQPQKKNSISSREEEGKYNAVVQFRPQSMLQRKLTTGGGGAATKKLSSSSATSSASLSQLADAFDELRPVPGTWLRSTKERCISHNKHLIRRAASESTLHIHRAVPVLRVASTRMLTPGRVANKCESAFVNRLWQTHNAAISVRAKGQSPTATVLKMIKSIARPKQRICAVAVLDKALSNKRRLRLGIQKTLLQKSAPKKMSVQLRCKSAKSVTAAVRLNIMWKEQKKQVAVTIMLAEDVPEVNWCRVNSALIREPIQQQQQQQKPISNSSSPLKRLLAMAQESNNGIGTKTAQKQQKQQATSAAPSANLSAQKLAGQPAGAATAKFGTTAQRQQQQQQLPAKQQQPGQAAHFGTGGAQQQKQQVPALILPDQSLLERYVQHKRDALDQLHNSDDDDAAGDAAAAVDEALHGTAATPSAPALFVPRTAAAAAVVSASLPGSKRNSQMLAAVPSGAELPQSLTGSFHSAIEATAADLRAAAAAAQPRLRRAQQQQQKQQIPILSTQTFEKPKSLFEEQMQRQAIQLRQRGAVARHSLHDDDAEAAPAAKTVQKQQQQQKQAAQAVPATQPQQRRQRSGDATART